MNFVETVYSRSPIAVQTILLNMKAVELYFERYGRKFHRLMEQFDQNQWLSASHLEAYQDEQRQRLIRHAYKTVPYYSEMMRRLKLTPNDVRTKADLPKLPQLTKENIRRNSTRLLSSAYPKILLRHGHTSGTTGT